MKILIVSNFASLPIEKGNNRFLYITNKIVCNTNDVELVTSDFRHSTKQYRKVNKNDLEKIPYKITLLHEPNYKKNVSIKRFYAHYIWGKNVKKYLNSIEKPDVIYCAVPSLTATYFAAKFCKKNKIKFIIDVQDLWPEAFQMVFNIPIISKIIFYPFKKIANYVYSNADEIIAVSETYAKRAASVNNHISSGISVFLGTDLSKFDLYAKNNKVQFNDDFIRIAYIGTLGHSYDIKIVIDAIKILNDKGINNIKFVVMGNGPLKNEFENYAKELNVNCEFTGNLVYEKMVGLLCSCDIAVNPIIEKSVASIINKVGDYAAAGLPVINTQNSDEYKNLVDNYQIGFNCMNDVNNIVNKLELLINDKKLREKLGKNNRKLGEEKFAREKTYLDIIKAIK